MDTTVHAGGMKVRIKLDTRIFDEFEGWAKQIPFALSLALNRTGKRAVVELRESLPLYFTIRNKWTAGSMRIKEVARKEDPRIEVGSVAKYMKPHAEGGPRDPGAKPSGAVPVMRWGSANTRSSMKEAFNKRNEWPRALLRQKKAVRFGNAILATDKYDKARPNKGLLYWIVKDADTKIKQDWPLEELVLNAFDRHWDRQARNAMIWAIRTAKRKG